MAKLGSSAFSVLLSMVFLEIVSGQQVINPFLPPQQGGGSGVAVSRKEMVPAMFIFGDSLIDNGNNNNLASFAKANYYPYGIDFNGGPTGRFSNGYTMVDEIGLLLFSVFSASEINNVTNVSLFACISILYKI